MSKNEAASRGAIKRPSRAKKSVTEAKRPPRITRAETLIGLMRRGGGASAAELAAAVGWQIHSVRGFIAGTVKKRAGLTVTTDRVDGVIRYLVTDASEPRR